MHSRRSLSAAVACAVVFTGVALPVLAADPPSRVVVTNLPDVQRVTGTVAVGQPVPQSALVTRRGVVVSPVPRADVGNLVDAGTINATGFTHVVLSLRGEVRGNLGRDGEVGVLLIPEEEPILEALVQRGRFDFALEVQAEVLRESGGYFTSPQPRHTLGFPRYRVFLFNTTERAVDADLYLYLTN